MALDPDSRYAALRSRDARFDGVFFVAVRTTGVYCRPVCPAPLPRPDHCTFFDTAAEAEHEGYRPCYRCRPELAPGNATVDARSRLARAAAARIEAGYLNDHGVAELAGALAVSARHLRRVVVAELGVSPVELAQTRRLAIAKQLLQDTTLPVTRVAFAAGFSSIRRFNAVVRERFQRPPTALRRSNGAVAPDGENASQSETFSLRLDYRPPLAWQSLTAFVGGRAVRGVESARGGVYRRWVEVDGEEPVAVAPVTVEPAPGRASSLLASIPIALAPRVTEIVTRLRILFDLDARPDLIEAHLGADPELAPMVEARPGLRVPGAFDPFELAIRTILGQQISVAAATTLCSRFARAFGRAAAEEILLFPKPSDVARLSVSEIRALGMPESRAATVLGLARAVADGDVELSAAADPEDAAARLLAIPGIGPWTTQYILLRALRWPNAFPANDLGIRKALGVSSAADADERSRAWEPWRAYAAVHLWTHLSTGEP